LNGAMGAIVVTTITFTAPRIGTFATIGLLIAGQLAMGVLIDALGLFGLERIPFGWERAVGLVLLGAGALLVLER
ncbi:MAG: DMT family transporter, partial [Gaiellaceae bacterium]